MTSSNTIVFCYVYFRANFVTVHNGVRTLFSAAVDTLPVAATAPGHCGEAERAV